MRPAEHGLSHVTLSADACLGRFADALEISGRRVGAGFFCFSLSPIVWLNGLIFVGSFSDIEWPFSAAAFFIHALPCAAMASELYVSLRLNILLIVHDVLECQVYCDNCFWDSYV